MKLLNVIISVILGACAMAVGLFTFWLFEPSSPHAEEISVKVLNTEGVPTLKFRAGGRVYFDRTLKGLKEIHDIQVWQVLTRDDNSEVIASAERTPIPIPLGISHRITHIDLPTDIKPGRYTLRVIVSYRRNPLQFTRVDFPPAVHFEVVK